MSLLYYSEIDNWGDKLAPVIYKHLGGGDEEYMVIGSILDQATPRTVVWGAGFISADSHLKHKPKRVCAVRGPLTRAMLVLQGVECPEVYGDPALLYPRFYDPPREKKWMIGLVPHYVDKTHPFVAAMDLEDDVKIIDIQGDVKDVVDKIAACEFVMSSCLHGIICADAYEVPRMWVELSDGVHGGGFKFRDYFAAVGTPHTTALDVTPDTTTADAVAHYKEYEVDIDLDALMAVCPLRGAA